MSQIEVDRSYSQLLSPGSGWARWAKYYRTGHFRPVPKDPSHFTTNSRSTMNTHLYIFQVRLSTALLREKSQNYKINGGSLQTATLGWLASRRPPARKLTKSCPPGGFPAVRTTGDNLDAHRIREFGSRERS